MQGARGREIACGEQMCEQWQGVRIRSGCTGLVHILVQRGAAGAQCLRHMGLISIAVMRLELVGICIQL
jgi:hypothetical protein